MLSTECSGHLAYNRSLHTAPRAFFYGCYAVIMLGAWPVTYLLDMLGLETYEPPTTGILWLSLGVNALLETFLSDYLWLLGMLLVSPTREATC